MKIDPPIIRSLLTELIDENPLACRAVFSITEVVFTRDIPTLCVSLGKPSVLRINEAFIAEHARTECEVKALLLHEFLHLLLRHTTKFASMTPARNLALDTVINAIIHRQLGRDYSSVFSRYYGASRGLFRLLRPPEPQDAALWNKLVQARPASPAQEEERELYRIQHAIYAGHLTTDDVYAFCRDLIARDARSLNDGDVTWIGSHTTWGDPLDDLDPDTAARIRSFFNTIGDRVSRTDKPPVTLKSGAGGSGLDPAWRRDVRGILERLLSHESPGQVFRNEPVASRLPVLTPNDRRGWLRALWNPLIAENAWPSHRRLQQDCVQVYFDVSGSMNGWFKPLVRLLAEFRSCIRNPFWAFSGIVEPATIRNGQLLTRSTGCTSLAAVLDHIRRTRPEKALLITDGFVESDLVPNLVRKAAFCRIEALITPGGCTELINRYGYPTTLLPPLHRSPVKVVRRGEPVHGSSGWSPPRDP